MARTRSGSVCLSVSKCFGPTKNRNGRRPGRRRLGADVVADIIARHRGVRCFRGNRQRVVRELGSARLHGRGHEVMRIDAGKIVGPLILRRRRKIRRLNAFHIAGDREQRFRLAQRHEHAAAGDRKHIAQARTPAHERVDRAPAVGDMDGGGHLVGIWRDAELLARVQAGRVLILKCNRHRGTTGVERTARRRGKQRAVQPRTLCRIVKLQRKRLRLIRWYVVGDEIDGFAIRPQVGQ